MRRVILTILGTLIAIFSFGCTRSKPYYSLYVKNQGGDKEKIADFFQETQGLDDCYILLKKWSENYSPTCERK